MNIYTPSEIMACHQQCLEDSMRTERYRRAITETVRPGDVVVDAGSGTGILGFFACQAGASKVYAVDPSDIIAHARQLAIANGFQDRFVFMKEISSGAQVPEPADVFIAGHIHNFALETGLLSSLLDARQRLVTRSARFIPEEVELFVVPVESVELYRKIDFWATAPYGFDFCSVRHFAANNCYKASLQPEAFLSEPERLFRIDSATVASTSLSSEVCLLSSRSGVVHGLGGWFRARLSPNVELTNDPRGKTAEWAQIFLPLIEPIPVAAREPIKIVVNTVDGEQWRWCVEAHGERREQCTLFGVPLDPKAALRQSPKFQPKLSRNGEAELFLLNSFTGGKTVEMIREDFLSVYSERFPSETAALAFFWKVLRLSQ